MAHCDNERVAIEALRRVAAATARAGDLAAAEEALDACRKAAEAALASLSVAWLSVDLDGLRDATVKAGRVDDWHRFGRSVHALVPASVDDEVLAWLSVDIEGLRDATALPERANDWRGLGRTIIPLAMPRARDADATPYCWVRETPGHFDPCHGGEPPSVEFLTESAPGSFPLFKGAGNDAAARPLVTTSSEPPPLPYTLPELQRVCVSKLGLTAEKTREIALDLYSELKVITYPLTDCGYLPDFLRKDVPQIMSALSMSPGMEVAGLESDLTLNSPAWNDIKLRGEDHHGIIPTVDFTPAKLKQMKPIEREVFDLIAWNFIVQFYPDCVQKTVTAEVRIDGGIVETAGSMIIENGWRDVLDQDCRGSSPQLLNERALETARRAYESKERDAFGPTPTEHPDDGGGPLGYAILAYLNAVKA